MELSPSQKGGLAELKIAAAAADLGFGILRPMTEGVRYDLVLRRRRDRCCESKSSGRPSKDSSCRSRFVPAATPPERLCPHAVQRGGDRGRCRLVPGTRSLLLPAYRGVPRAHECAPAGRAPRQTAAAAVFGRFPVPAWGCSSAGRASRWQCERSGVRAPSAPPLRSCRRRSQRGLRAARSGNGRDMAAEEPFDATPFLPERRTLDALREAAADCSGCDLWRPATQTVFGEGAEARGFMLVGEQPGDREDLAGGRSSGPPGACSTGRSRRPASTARRLRHERRQALQSRSAASAASTRSRRQARSRPAGRGSGRARPPAPRVARAARRDGGAGAARRAFRSCRARRPLDCDLAPVVIATIHPSSILRGPTARRARPSATC